jgi:hypothetical protein
MNTGLSEQFTVGNPGFSEESHIWGLRVMRKLSGLDFFQKVSCQFSDQRD